MKYSICLVLAGIMTGLASSVWAADDQRVGQHFDISPQSLPAPYATTSASNAPDILARPANATLHVPPGFTASVFAGGLEHPRWLTVAKNGDVFVAESDMGKVTLLRDADGDGKAEFRTTFADNFDQPHGLAFHDGALYVADVRAVWRIPYTDGVLKGAGRTAVTPVGAFGGGGDHWTRNIVFDPKGRLFIAIGSSANVAEDPAPRATVQLFENGKLRTFASGLRNAVGMAFYPGTDDLYVVVNERDGLGDGLVPDFFTRLTEGGFYGWPYAYIGHHPDPRFGAKRPDLVTKSLAPDILFQSHSAPLGLQFYDAQQFPPSYRGGAFVSLHGSWNAAQPTGYKIVYVPFRDNRPAGGYDNFATGFWAANSGDQFSLSKSFKTALGLRPKGAVTASVWGRPVGLAIAKDGSLLVADDTGKAVWRIAYTGKNR